MNKFSSLLKICLICNNPFLVQPHLIKKGFGKFCSHSCYSKSLKYKTGALSNQWRGNNVGYHGIHIWLRKKFGKASKCENENCSNLNSKRFEWAKLRDKEYERKRENFWQLCTKCHVAYDERSNNKWRIGRKFSNQHRLNLSLSLKGRIPWNKGLKMKGVNS